jgi:hypothetical protein
MRLSVILLPQSRGFKEAVLYLRVLYGVVISAGGAADGDWEALSALQNDLKSARCTQESKEEEETT